MPTPLAVLIVEDMESDAQLTVRLLKKTGYEVVYEQVETAEQMRAALAKRTWDIVISDYKMPQFDGRAALTILKETGLDIPFIIVSGTIGEETAVSMMKAGAQDYLIKGDLGRLIPAVERELEQAIVRRERSLAQEQLLLRSSALSAAANAIVITDHDGTIEWINPAFSILTGYKLEETIGKNPRTLVNSGRQDHAYYKNLWDTILSGKVWQGELVNRRKDGSFYTEEETITPLKNEDGTISYFIAIKQDISERKQAEDALRESEERYHSLFDRMLDGVYRSTHEGKFVNVNPAMVKMFGYSSKEEMLEMDIKTELYFEPDERGTHILDSGQGEIDLYRLRRKDGSEIWVEDRGTYIYDEQGRITYHEGIMRDVTKRVQAEQALAISESELRALVEQVPAIVYTESVETRQTLYISPQVEKLTGYTSAEWINDRHLWRKITHPEDLAALLAEDERTTATHEPFSIEYRILTRDGRPLWIRDEAVMIQKQDGTALFWQGVMHDITERKQAEEALQASEERFHSIYDNTMIGLYRTTPDGQILMSNPAGLRMLGYDLFDEIIKRNLEDTGFEPDHSRREFRERLEREGVINNFESKWRKKDGSLIIVRENAVAIRDKNGKILFYDGSFEDITEVKQAEELVRQQSEQLRLLYEANQRLNSTLDLKEIYQAICDFMSSVADNDGLIISAFDPETQLITCRAYWLENIWLDVSPFPSIALEAEGRGTQSIAIRTGQAMMLNDYLAYQKTSATVYYVDSETNEVNEDIPPEEDLPRSALIVPLKIGGRVSGVIQITSHRLNAYTETQLKLLEALALHIASAEQNALLYARVQTELNERKQAEQSLRASEEQYRTLVEQLPAIVFIDDVNEEGRTLYISPQIETILGFTPQAWRENASGLWNKQVHPDDRKRVHAEYLRCFLDGEPYEAEYRIIASDGRLLWFHDQAVMIHDGNSKPHLIHGLMYDITERKQTEEFLQMSEERYRGLFNSMIDGFALHEIICDENGNPIDYRFLEVNPAFERLTGLQSANVIGQTVLEILPNTELYWIEVFGNVALTGRSTFYENYSREIGRYFEVSVYCPKARQFAVIMVDITERKQAEEATRQHVTELEMLYQSGLALNQFLDPKEIGQKVVDLLEDKLNCQHVVIYLHRLHENTLELLAYHHQGLQNEKEKHEAEKNFQILISRSSWGLNGWVIQHGLPVRSGDVINDPRYVEAYPGIRSGLYVPMKLGERIVGVINIEDEQLDAFSEADERLIVTLANQAASAFENARLFEATRQRVLELETINRISHALRSVTKQEEMLSIVLDEALDILNTSHGSILLYKKNTETLEKIITRGWSAQVVEPPQDSHEGIAGKVFTSGEKHISREFASDPETHAEARSQIPAGWGGICLPIRTSQLTLGVMSVSIPSERELDQDEIRLLETLSEMTGAALQRMQLHGQTVRRLQQLHALRAIDQAISSSRDMHLTLNILITQTISQLGMDAADVLLLHLDTNQLELVTSYGFHTSLFKNISLSDSVAGHTIIEHRSITTLDFKTAMSHENRQLGNFWKEEGFACYWCVPLIVKGEVKGVLEVYRRTAFTPDAEWIEFLEAMAGQAAIAIDNTQLFDNLQRANLDLSLAYDATIEGWSRAMDLRDHETEGHTLRVTDLTLKLARAMRISDSQLTAVRRGALLHDIGKMGVPDAILLKEGALTDEEWVLMHQHPQLAHDMLAPIAYLNDALNIPYCHHEKWDGTGYPQGLKGDHIPLVARIFAIIDVWDALTNDRTYRKKWTKQKARQFIQEQSGKHFDPQVVDAFLKIIEKD